MSISIFSLTLLVIILESRHLSATSSEDEDVHDHHPVLKEKLSPGDKCWQTEEFVVREQCDLCTGN
jgi:hypothetical protein